MSKTGKKYNFKNNFQTFNIQNIEFDGNNVLFNDVKPLINNLYTYINFDTVTHYDELLEIKKVALGLDSNNTASIPLKNIDELNLYKFSSKLEYNFLIKNFEENSKNLSSLEIPNFYKVVKDSIETNEYSTFEGTSYLEDSQIFLSTSLQQEPYIINSYNSKILLNGKTLTLENYLKRFSSFKEQFPFYTEIKFDTHEKVNKNVSEIFDKYNLYNRIFSSLVNSTENQELIINNNNESKEYKTLTLNQEYIQSLLQENADLNANFIFDLNSVLEPKLDDIKAVLSNKKSYAEVIGYHIRKYEGISKPTETSRGSPLQHWYIPNVFNGRPELIDTQLIYSKEYTYSINPIILTFLYNITYSSLDNIKYQYSFNPSVKILDLNDVGPVYTNTLLDSPPTEPELEVIPFIGIPNKVQINLNTSIGRKSVEPIFFNDAEKQRIDKLIVSKNNMVEDNLLFFQSDEPSEFFEIYRLPFKPVSYLDFVNSPLTKVPTLGTSGASIIDTITQNRKYYYTARSIDYHGNISNPTVIYEVEILNDNGLIIPYINVVDFYNVDEKKAFARNIKRFLQLAPAARHIAIDEESINSQSIKLGSDEINVWDQKYKIRITSKKTGKKVDLYATFKYKKKDS